MKIYEIAFCAVCAALCAGSVWLAALIEEPFLPCTCVFLAAFWGSLAAFCVWGRISEREERDAAFWRPTPINNLPNRWRI